MGEAVPTMVMGLGEAVPTTGMGSKWDGRILDRQFGEQVVIKFIVRWVGWEWGAPNSLWDSWPIPITVPSTMGIPVPLSPVINNP